MGTELAVLLIVHNTLLAVCLGVATATRAIRVPTSFRTRRTDPR